MLSKEQILENIEHYQELSDKYSADAKIEKFGSAQYYLCFNLQKSYEMAVEVLKEVLEDE